MRSIVSNPLAMLALATSSLMASSRAWASPTSASMTQEVATAVSADVYPGVYRDAAPAASVTPASSIAPLSFTTLTPLPGPGESSLTTADDLFADEHEISPSDPHPMIPLPPSAWAGFIGLAVVARRVLRRHPIASL